MSARKRVQVNIELNQTILNHPNMKRLFFPVAWFDLESTVSDKLAEEFKNQVYLAEKIKNNIPLVCGCVAGGFLLLAAIVGLMGVMQPNWGKDDLPSLAYQSVSVN